MKIRRIVPDIKSDNLNQSHDFYADFLGMDVAMEKDEIVTFASPNNPTAQINILKPLPGVPHPHISIEVEDVDQKYKDAHDADFDIVYPLTDEPWGVRRFFAKDANEIIINILTHI